MTWLPSEECVHEITSSLPLFLLFCSSLFSPPLSSFSFSISPLFSPFLSFPGCLLQYLRQRKELIEKKEVILDMATQVCSAMKYLEANGFIHRDLVSTDRQTDGYC